MISDLSSMFNPKSVAVIGASKVATKVGAVVLKNLIASGYTGMIYPVNPTITSVGRLKFFPNVASLPEIPDLAVIAIPAKLVIDELEECGRVGIKNIVIFSSGFKEVGKSGEELERQLVAVSSKYELNILGPNCLGFASTSLPLNVTFGQLVKESGNLRLISQSGALAASFFDWCQSTSLGFRDFVTIGNKSVINENDILKYWLPKLSQSPTPVGLYLESINQGEEFVEIIGKITPYNPVFVLKPGKSAGAVAAMQSHTGAIAGEDRIFESALEKVGAIRCEEMGDFFDLAQAFAWGKTPKGPEVAVISNAGGPAVLATDTITSLGLGVAKLSKTSIDRLQECLPRIASIINPVDVLGDALAQRFGQALEIVLQEETVDSVVVILTPQLMTQIEKTAEVIGQLSSKYPKPVLCSFVGGNHVVEGQRVLNSHKIPSFAFPERAIKALSAMWRWEKWRKNPILATISESVNTNNIEVIEALEKSDIDRLMKAIDVPIPPSMAVNTIDEAMSFAQKYSWPLVLKLIAPGLLHKTDVGGVKINIKTIAELTEAFSKLSNIKSLGKIQIQKQVETGIEVIVGAKRDLSFGPVLLFGAGGKYAEILDDHNLVLPPLSFEEARSLVSQSKVFRFLSGFRDDPAYQLDQLYKVIVNLSQLMTDHHQITDIEINPLIITHHGSWAVDVKVLTGP